MLGGRRYVAGDTVKVRSVYFIKDRGHAADVVLDDRTGPRPGDTLRRSDDREWTVVDVDWCSGGGERVGLLLSDEECQIAEGDEVSLVLSRP